MFCTNLLSREMRLSAKGWAEQIWLPCEHVDMLYTSVASVQRLRKNPQMEKNLCSSYLLGQCCAFTGGMHFVVGFNSSSDIHVTATWCQVPEMRRYTHWQMCIFGFEFVPCHLLIWSLGKIILIVWAWISPVVKQNLCCLPVQTLLGQQPFCHSYLLLRRTMGLGLEGGRMPLLYWGRGQLRVKQMTPSPCAELSTLLIGQNKRTKKKVAYIGNVEFPLHDQILCKKWILCF